MQPADGGARTLGRADPRGRPREIVSRMQPDDFWIPGNRMVFEAMCAAAQTATMVTVFDVKARLELEGRLDMAGGLPRLIELEGPSVSILTWTSEMTELRHLADRRRLMLSASGILEDAQSMQVGLPTDRSGGWGDPGCHS